MRRLLRRNVLGVLMALAVIGFTTAPAFADPRDFVLHNDTDSTILFVYVSPSNQTDWGEDILDEDVLEAGEKVTIRFSRFTPGDCLYDIKVETDDGREGVMSRVNLCDTTSVTFHED